MRLHFRALQIASHCSTISAWGCHARQGKSGAEQTSGLLLRRKDVLSRFVHDALTGGGIAHVASTSLGPLRPYDVVIAVEREITRDARARIVKLAGSHERVVVVASLRDDEEIQVLNLGAHAVWRTPIDEALLVARATAIAGLGTRQPDRQTVARLRGHELEIGGHVFPLARRKRRLLIETLMRRAGDYVPSEVLRGELYGSRCHDCDPTNALRQLVYRTKEMLGCEGWRIDGDPHRGYAWRGPCVCAATRAAS